MSLLTIALSLSSASIGAVAARAVGSVGAVTVTGENNTLASIAADVGDPKLFRLEGKRAICAGAFTLNGGLTMGPGEVLVMENPQGEWARRLVYLLGGPMEFRDCAIEGAYWVHVGPEARGRWRDFRIISGPNTSSGYPLLYFVSSGVDWDGGALDAAPSAEVYTPVALSPRGGYYPGSVRGTVRNVTIRARRTAILDRADGKGHTVDLTFQGCRFQAEEALVWSNASVADGDRTRLVFEECRWEKVGQAVSLPSVDPKQAAKLPSGNARQANSLPHVQLSGSAVEVVVVREGKRVAHRAPDLRRSGTGDAGDLGARLAREVPELHAGLARLSEREELRGSLYYSRSLLARLERIARGLEETGQFGDADVAAVDRLVEPIRDMIDKLPRTLEAGSPYRPMPAPPSPPPSGKARVVQEGPGRVRVESSESTIFYDGRADEKRRARVTEESTVRGHRLFHAYPELGGPSLRHASPTESSLMLWEQPWDVEIVQSDARIVGFKARLHRFDRSGTAVTHVFFCDLPDVILYDVESIQRETPPQPPRVRFAAYTDPARATYNGMRFWSLDPEGIRRSDGAGATERVFASDPLNGVFLTGPGEWYEPELVRGLVVAQYNGYNDWRTAPPCGYILRAGGRSMLYANNGGYYAHVVDLPPPPAGDPEPLRHRLLWFEGWGLRCWENIFNLEAAFNHPCRLEPVALRAGAEPEVTVAEVDGLQRHFEIVILPGAFNHIRTERDVFRGDSTVFLLRDVALGARVKLGTLPLRLVAAGPDRFRITSQLAAPLARVQVRLPVGGSRVTAVRHAGQPVAAWSHTGDEVVYVAMIAPGESEVVVERRDAAGG